MSPALSFVLALVVTLGLLTCVVVTGLRKKRKPHITFVVLALLSLGATIWRAERLGEHYDLESAGAITEIHLMLAKLCVCAYLLPVATGLLSLRRPRLVTWHGRLAFLALGLTIASAVTGTAMLLLSEPLPRP